MNGVIITLGHVVVYSGLGIVCLAVRTRLSYIPFYLYLGILQVYISLLSSLYLLDLGGSVEIGGGNIVYAAIIWCVLLVYLIERDITTIRMIIFSLITVQLVFLVTYPLFALVLTDPQTINPLDIPSQIFKTSFGIFLVGNFLMLSELIAMIYLLENPVQTRYKIPLTVRAVFIYIIILLIDGILFPLFAYPIIQSLSIVQGIASLLNKFLLGITFSGALIIAIRILQPQFSQISNNYDIRLRDLLILPKIQVIEELQSIEEQQTMLRLLIDLLSHDLRNYTHTTLLALNLLKRSTSEELTSDTMIIENTIQTQENINSLVTNVLALNQVQTKNIKPEDVRLDILFANAILKVQQTYSYIPLIIKNQEIFKEVTVLIHPLLEDLLYNLLTNAVKYRKKSQQTVEIDLDLEKSKNKIHISIGDRGQGIPDDQKPMIFQRLDKHGSRGGIGLSIVSAILSNFKGKIWVTNRNDNPEDWREGSIFHIELPVR